MSAPDWKAVARTLFDALCEAHHPSSCQTKLGNPCSCGRDEAFRVWAVAAEADDET